MKREGKGKCITMDILWLVVFTVVWYGLFALWNTVWVLLLLPVFTLMLAGLSEIMHQGVHGNLFAGNTAANRFLGAIAGAMTGVNSRAYWSFHRVHHAETHTREDPEKRIIYSTRVYAGKVAGWNELGWWQKIHRIPGIMGVFGGLFLAEVGKGRLVRSVQWGIPVLLGVVGYMEGLKYWLLIKVLVVWFLPLFFFLPLCDLVLTLSRHYGYREEDTPHLNTREQHQLSWNLRLPWFVTFMFFGRNLHAEHHLNPKQHWMLMHADQNRNLSVGRYLGWLWKHGPQLRLE